MDVACGGRLGGLMSAIKLWLSLGARLVAYNNFARRSPHQNTGEVEDRKGEMTGWQ